MTSGMRVAAFAAAMALLCAGCAKKVAEAPGGASVEGVATTPGSFLAYEHDVRYHVEGDTIAARVEAVRDACVAGRAGACSVLEMQVASGEWPSGSITVRVVPDGVEKLVALGARGAEPVQRTTKAEDLALAVADVARRRAELERQRSRYQELLDRPGLAVGDLVTLTQHLAAVDAELDALARTTAEHQRRLETNRLTLAYASDAAAAGDGATFAGLWDTFAESFGYGVEEAAEYGGWLLPIALVLFPFALLWRFAWRRATGAARRAPA